MKRSIVYILLLFYFSTAFTQQNERTRLFDDNWRFKKDSFAAAAGESFNDSDWRLVQLPHDWSIEDLPNQIPDSIVGPFSKAAISKHAGGFMVGGTAWYRKQFLTDKASAGKETYIQFDGVYMNADVWVNGHHLGNHPYGYTSFYYNLTPWLKPAGQSNTMAVQVKNEGYNSRWYSGSGIYRHVWLTTVNPAHIQTWGTYITTPAVAEKSAAVRIETTIDNHSRRKMPMIVLIELYTAAGKLVATDKQNIAASADSNIHISQTISVAHPQLWSIENPYLYQARTKLLQDGKLIDETVSSFGIRAIHFDAKTGFTLNDKSIKIKGGCIHHDNGPLGAAAIDRAEERKIQLLKQQGYNAVRLSHNPPSPYLLDVCDRLGMLVIDEAFDMWEKMKNPRDYHLYFADWSQKDIQSMVLRDRNHPSVIMWSIGNEIPEVVNAAGYQIGHELAAAIRRLDTTRPVTMAITAFATLSERGKKWDDTAPSFANLDVTGYNYGMNLYEKDHVKYPDRVMYASEYFPTKGIENWQKAEALPYLIGTFSWSAMDYLGEAGLGVARLIPIDGKGSTGTDLFLDPSWPINVSGTGELDLTGNKKAASYYLDVVWKTSPVEMLVHTPIPDGYKEANFYYNFPDQVKSWTWPAQEGKKMQVFVYSRNNKVTLELNGRLIAEQTLPQDNIVAKFDLHYEPGTLIAKSYDGDRQTGADTLKTVGKPFAIRLSADRNSIKADRNDLSYISVELIDDRGNIVPYIDDLLIKYQLAGNGVIAGVGNGNPGDVSSFQQPQKKVYHGRGLIIVRPEGAAGRITLKANAEGLAEGSVEISTKQ
jgi:beta-galactosidase